MPHFLYRIPPTRIDMLTEGPSDSHAAALVSDDPAVKKGGMRAELLPFHMAPWANDTRVECAGPAWHSSSYSR